MSECLHCEINELVRQRIENESAEGADIAELSSMIVESLAELILLAPESERANLVAEAIAHFGHSLLEKSGALGGEGSSATH